MWALAIVSNAKCRLYIFQHEGGGGEGELCITMTDAFLYADFTKCIDMWICRP